MRSLKLMGNPKQALYRLLDLLAQVTRRHCHRHHRHHRHHRQHRHHRHHRHRHLHLRSPPPLSPGAQLVDELKICEEEAEAKGVAREPSVEGAAGRADALDSSWHDGARIADGVLRAPRARSSRSRS